MFESHMRGKSCLRWKDNFRCFRRSSHACGRTGADSGLRPNYYNGCLFHRNIKGFMVQTGDPTGTGKGGESIWGENFANEIQDGLKHSVRGVVSMANNGPNTNASQFFITYAKQPHLDQKYTVFGKVIDGLDTLEELEKVPVNPKYRPLRDIKLNSVTIHANPFAE
ncbi:peptidyl-prolyl cis-trans isomerase-like 3 isoform X23 [Rhipicephalus microplus]|uniref:peptidyl-prolyl cis-trans isomerase-like 3 isoform X23 n=1 Tax=Rhipicephalus microplus TaxID=6941 RepID=UPI003F6B9BF8